MSRTLPLESSLRLGMFESIRAAAISSRYSVSGASSVPRVDASWFESGKEKKTYSSYVNLQVLLRKPVISRLQRFSASAAASGSR